MGNVAGGVVTIVFFIGLAYVIKLDMADMTGLSRKAAAQKMKPLAETLGYSLIAARTPHQQGGIEKSFGSFSIMVSGDRSRIEVEFKRPLGLLLSSLKKNDFSHGEFQPLQFTNKHLNGFFHLKASKSMPNSVKDQLEQALLPLSEKFDNRKVEYLYIKDEYLRLGFAHRNYLPVSVIEEAVPILEDVAGALLAVQKESRKNT